jgi:hypothetical protein
MCDKTLINNLNIITFIIKRIKTIKQSLNLFNLQLILPNKKYKYRIQINHIKYWLVLYWIWFKSIINRHNFTK